MEIAVPSYVRLFTDGLHTFKLINDGLKCGFYSALAGH